MNEQQLKKITENTLKTYLQYTTISASTEKLLINQTSLLQPQNTLITDIRITLKQNNIAQKTLRTTPTIDNT